MKRFRPKADEEASEDVVQPRPRLTHEPANDGFTQATLGDTLKLSEDAQTSSPADGDAETHADSLQDKLLPDLPKFG